MLSSFHQGWLGRWQSCDMPPASASAEAWPNAQVFRWKFHLTSVCIGGAAWNPGQTDAERQRVAHHSTGGEWYSRLGGVPRRVQVPCHQLIHPGATSRLHPRQKLRPTRSVQPSLVVSPPSEYWWNAPPQLLIAHLSMQGGPPFSQLHGCNVPKNVNNIGLFPVNLLLSSLADWEI